MCVGWESLINMRKYTSTAVTEQIIKENKKAFLPFFTRYAVCCCHQAVKEENYNYKFLTGDRGRHLVMKGSKSVTAILAPSCFKKNAKKKMGNKSLKQF